MWVTKDKSGYLQLWENKPVRHNPPFVRRWWNWCNKSDFYWRVGADGGFFTILDNDRYPQYDLTLTWECEPLEVKLIDVYSEEMIKVSTKGVTNKEMIELLSQFPDDATVVVECCDVKRMGYCEKDNTIRID